MELLFAFAAAAGTALLLTPAVRAWARAGGRVARPSGDRWHDHPTALFGGIAIFLAFVAGTSAMAAQTLAAGGSEAFGGGDWKSALAVLIAGAIMFGSGVADDALTLRPTSKLVLQGLGGASLVALDVVYAATPWPLVNGLLTIFWFIALSNALNLLDNMDGISAGVAGIAAFFFAGLFAWQQAWVLAGVSLALAAAAGGFLPYNFRPASIFMGDSGSLFLGGALAGLGAAYSTVAADRPLAGMLVPVLLVAVPLFDTTLVTVTRTMARYSIAQGGRDHVSHRLVAMGLAQSSAALVLYGVAAVGGALGLLVRGGFGEAPWLVSLYMVALVVVGAYLHRFYRYPPEGARPARRLALLIDELLVKRRLLEVVFDLVLFTAAYAGAYLLRYDTPLPEAHATLLFGTVAIAVACKSAAFSLAGVYRGTWRQIGMADVHTLLSGTFFGVLLTVSLIVFFYREAEFSRSVFVLDGILVLLLAIGARASFRSLDLLRLALNGDEGERTLVYGAGSGGDLVLREIRSNPDLRLRPVGFVDDDPALQGRTRYGLPVLGRAERLAGIVDDCDARTLVIGTRTLQPDRMDELRAVCAAKKLRLLRLELELCPVPLVHRAEPLPAPRAGVRSAPAPVPVPVSLRARRPA